MSETPLNGPAQGASGGLRVSWRALEWGGSALSIFLLSGAVFPLLLMMQSGQLDNDERAILRLLQVPVFIITLVLLMRHLGPLVLALRRTLPLVFLSCMAFASVYWSIVPEISLRRAIALLGSILLAYLLAIRFSPRQILVLFSGVIGLCLGLSLVTVVIFPDAAFMPDGTGMRGVYTHKNVLGWAACVGVILALGLIADQNPRFRLLGRGLLLLSVVCLILSASSTGLLAAFCGLILTGFYGLLRRARPQLRQVLILIAVQVAALLFLFLADVLVALLESLGKDATLTGRVPLWAIVDGYIRERPWIGYGYQAFWSLQHPVSLEIAQTLQWYPPHAHSGYREVLLNFGVIGLVLFLVAVAQAIWRGAKLDFSFPGQSWCWVNVTVGVMLVMNLSESNFLAQNDIQWLLMMTAFAMVALHGPSVDTHRQMDERLHHPEYLTIHN